jgi:hypothetical protein
MAKKGYTYSVFNLVYETNLASCRIWDALGFRRIGRVPGCGILRSHASPVDALIYGRALGDSSLDPALSGGLTEEDVATQERFDKIRFYLRSGRYPDGADRAEKSRLRSAAGNYRLVMAPREDEGLGADADEAADEERGGGRGGEVVEKLLLRDKEVVSSARRQYAIARALHARHHGGINRTTASIAERFHWLRIKDTATLAIRNCEACGRTAGGGAGGGSGNGVAAAAVVGGGTGNVLLAAEGLQALRDGPATATVPAAAAVVGFAPISAPAYLTPDPDGVVAVGQQTVVPMDVVDPMLLDGRFGGRVDDNGAQAAPGGDADDIDAMERLLQPLNAR